MSRLNDVLAGRLVNELSEADMKLAYIAMAEDREEGVEALQELRLTTPGPELDDMIRRHTESAKEYRRIAAEL